MVNLLLQRFNGPPVGSSASQKAAFNREKNSIQGRFVIVKKDTDNQSVKDIM